MKLFFTEENLTSLSDKESKILTAIKDNLLLAEGVHEVFNPDKADAIIIQEENSFKNFRYIKNLELDELVSAYPEKVFTINSDDCATGLLRGLYTSLPSYKYNPNIHALVPYMHFPNEYINAEHSDQQTPVYLAGWRGNINSNSLRPKMVSLLETKSDFCIEKTDSWLNHDEDEKKAYVNVIRASKFSLCPAGWVPVSFRIYESMALGRCPVILADDFVPPNGPDWRDFALFYPEKELGGLPSFLRRNEYLAMGMGKSALEAWRKYFSSDVINQYYANTLLTLLRQSPVTTKEAELKRWKSLSMYWKNEWTLPQRVLNKLNYKYGTSSFKA
ncbi:exostosin domain-containing protein [Pedobacter immunditicola]|uniref:exostosin domain-containing protein n=1 Tax=Pedobacter immunditicola TaxID=3133440 RepID=UPI0030A02ED0